LFTEELGLTPSLKFFAYSDILKLFSEKSFNDQMADALLGCLPKRANFHPNFQVKLKRLLQQREIGRPKVKILFHLMANDYEEAKVSLSISTNNNQQ